MASRFLDYLEVAAREDEKRQPTGVTEVLPHGHRQIKSPIPVAGLHMLCSLIAYNVLLRKTRQVPGGSHGTSPNLTHPWRS